jgi:hypothetical protein
MNNTAGILSFEEKFTNAKKVFFSCQNLSLQLFVIFTEAQPVFAKLMST